MSTPAVLHSGAEANLDDGMEMCVKIISSQLVCQLSYLESLCINH